MPTEYYPLIEMALVLIVVVGWGVRELVALRRYRARSAKQAAGDGSSVAETAASDTAPRPGQRQS